MKKLIIPLSIVLVAILVICLVPLKTAAYTAVIDFEDTETYYEDEPYEDIETYYEEVPLGYEVVKSYIENDVIKEHHQIIIGGVVFQDEIVEVPIQVACVDVKNTDTIAGTFTVVFSVTEPMLGEYSLTTELDLAPNQTKTATCPSEELGEWSFKITPDTKTIEKQRTVTKYEQVEKQRTVWKERSETHYKKVTLLDYFLHY